MTRDECAQPGGAMLLVEGDVGLVGADEIGGGLDDGDVDTQSAPSRCAARVVGAVSIRFAWSQPAPELLWHALDLAVQPDTEQACAPPASAAAAAR